MPNHVLKSASLTQGVVALEFAGEQGEAGITITMPVENANQLAVGVLNALQAANQEAFPALSFARQQMKFTAYWLDQWRVSTAETHPGWAFLHLLSKDGLSMTYALGTDVTRFMGEALVAIAQDKPRETKN
jgi:hypothetical protein